MRYVVIYLVCGLLLTCVTAWVVSNDPRSDEVKSRPVALFLAYLFICLFWPVFSLILLLKRDRKPI